MVRVNDITGDIADLAMFDGADEDDNERKKLTEDVCLKASDGMHSINQNNDRKLTLK